MKTRVQSIVERALGYGLVAGAMLGFSFFYTKVNTSQKGTIEDLKKKIVEFQATKQKAESEFQERKVQIEKITQQLDARQNEVKQKFNQLLDKPVNYPIFIEQVQRKAKALDINIINSQYEPPSRVQGAPAAYLEFKFTMNITGNYEKMKQFLWEMENAMGRFVKIGQMNIRPPICDAAGNMNLTIVLATFFLP